MYLTHVIDNQNMSSFLWEPLHTII